MGSKSSSAPAPDPRLVEAQIRSMGIQDEAIQKVLANSEAMMPLQKEQMQFALDTSKAAYDQSQQDRTWMMGRRNQLSGLQDQLVTDAKSFNEGERGEELAGEAAADVTSGFTAARGQSMRALARQGVTPGSGRAMAMDQNLQTAQALALAGGKNSARAAARTEGRALTDRATNALAGYPSMSMTATGQGAGFGANGLSIANTGLSGMNSGYGMGSQMAGQMGSNATSMWGSQANYKLGSDRLKADNDPFKTMLGAATAVGTNWALGKVSDRRLKTDIKRVGKTKDGLPIYTYRYKEGGPVQMGVMADEVEDVTPKAVIKGGAGNGFDAVDYSQL